MTYQHDAKNDPNPPVVYQIKIKGHLDRQWAEWFTGLAITHDNSGNTLITGPVLDQAALYGLLRKVRDLGLPLLAVQRLQPDQNDHPDHKF